MLVIMVGICIVMVLIIGIVIFVVLIGVGGFGDLILLGIDCNDNSLILLGVILVVLLVILFDFLLCFFEKVFFKSMIIMILVGILLIVVIIVVFYFVFDKKEIMIVGKLGVELEILINMYKLVIEDEIDLKVNVKLNMGKMSFVFNVLKLGDIDIYFEFIGIVLEIFLKENVKIYDFEEVYM